MSYKELADAICPASPQPSDATRREVEAILRSLDARRPTVNSVMYLIQQYGGKKGAQKEDNATQCLAEIQALVEALAEPVAVQPQQAIHSWMKPHPKCDEACMYSCTEGFTKFPDCTQQSKPEPLTADDLKEPKNGKQWHVEWWNESCRMMLPSGSKLDSFHSYKNGTLQFTIKKTDKSIKE